MADFTGTFKGLMKGLNGKIIHHTNKKFHIDFVPLSTGRAEKYWKRGYSMTWWEF
jgi:hypothetical protein